MIKRIFSVFNQTYIGNENTFNAQIHRELNKSQISITPDLLKSFEKRVVH